MVNPSVTKAAIYDPNVGETVSAISGVGNTASQLCWCHTGPWKVGWTYHDSMLPSETQESFPVPALWQSCEMRCEAVPGYMLRHPMCPFLHCGLLWTALWPCMNCAFCPEKGEWLPSTPGPSPFKHTWLNSFCHCYHKWPWAWWLEITEGYYSLIVPRPKYGIQNQSLTRVFGGSRGNPSLFDLLLAVGVLWLVVASLQSLLLGPHCLFSLCVVALCLFLVRICTVLAFSTHLDNPG